MIKINKFRSSVVLQHIHLILYLRKIQLFLIQNQKGDKIKISIKTILNLKKILFIKEH
jgi:hypothetical protein